MSAPKQIEAAQEVLAPAELRHRGTRPRPPPRAFRSACYDFGTRGLRRPAGLANARPVFRRKSSRPTSAELRLARRATQRRNAPVRIDRTLATGASCTCAMRRRASKDHDLSKKLYVGNLPFTSSEGELRTLFARHGAVDSVAVINDRETGRPRGFAFVEMTDEMGC
jgi:hypothetical protein